MNCTVFHRNGRASPIDLSPTSLLIIKNQEKCYAFINPIGSSSNADNKVVDEWLS